ncbi:MAG: hypothetical protein Q8L51_02300 [Candidatus Amesbacteria bacterium]|nr:hypothetical protein [Candidatus Amesbacteria bacterium]
MKWILIINLILLNLGLGWLFYKSLNQTVLNVLPVVKTEYIDKCGSECQKYIDAKIVFPNPSPSTITKTVYQTIPKTKTKSIVYVPISGSGSTTANDWTSISGTDFYLDKADYKGLQEISFEGNLKLFNGNGIAYMRLFDVTHGIAVQSSDAQTSSQTSTPVNSGAINLWSGKNLYRVQLKTLTADTAVFDGGKLKITVLN